MTFVVVENTPGYLPENDDPPEFEAFAEAEEYAAALAEGYVDTWGLTQADDTLSVARVCEHLWVIASQRAHDLGRVVEIVERTDV